MAPKHLIGLVFDTHGQFGGEVVPALAGVSLILHAGDVGGAAVLQRLQSIAPLRAVSGNVDDPSDPQLQMRFQLEVGGLTVHVSHGHELGSPTPARLLRAYPADVVGFGPTPPA